MKISLYRPSQEQVARMLGLFLLALTIGAYGQVMGFDFICFDDPAYVFGNNHIRGGITWPGLSWAFTRFYASNWHPLTWLSHMLDVQLYGLKPAGHHLTSVIIHAVNALLLFLLLRETTNALWRSFLVAAFFALHPLHIESVAWVSERKDLLSTFFGLLAMISYIRYAKDLRHYWYLSSLFLFALGLMAKPMIVTLPFLFLLFDYWPLGRFPRRGTSDGLNAAAISAYPERNLKHILLEKIPFLILAGASAVVTYIAQGEGRAIQSWENLPLKERSWNAIYSYVQYIYKTFWPKELAVFYPHQGGTLGIGIVLASALFLLLISISAFIFLRRKPYLAIGWFWFLGTLTPVIGIVQVGAQGMADRYTYIPLIGLFLAIVWGASDFLAKMKSARSLQILLSIVTIAALASTTEWQLYYWKNTAALFNRALVVTERNYMAHYILATIEEPLGIMDSRKDHYRQAVAINPRFVAAMHNRTGYYLMEDGLSNEAIAQFETALRVMPDYIYARNNLGVALAKKGQFKEAIEQLRGVLKRNPHFTSARDNLYNVYRERASLQKGPDTKRRGTK